MVTGMVALTPHATTLKRETIGLSDKLRSGIVRPLAGVAQLVEQRIRNAKVDSSSPSIGTMKIKGLRKRNPLIFMIGS